MYTASMALSCHVAHLVSASSPHDAVRFFDEIKPILAARGFDGHLIRWPDGVERVKAGSTSCWGMWDIMPLIRQLNRQGINIVHTHDPEILAPAALAARLTGRPLVHTQHVKDIPKIAAWIRWLKPLVVAASPAIHGQCRKNFSLPDNIIHIIPQGLGGQRYAKEVTKEEKLKKREALGITAGDLVIGHPGPLVPAADHATLIKAFQRLINKKAKAHLLCYSHAQTPPTSLASLAPLASLAQDAEIAGVVKFMDSRHMPEDEFIGMLDVMVVSNYQEFSVYPFLEALALGVPVVATKIGFHEDVIKDSETGFLVPCGFPERIESALMRFYARRALLKEMGEAGREWWKANFQLQACADKYKALYLDFRHFPELKNGLAKRIPRGNLI